MQKRNILIGIVVLVVVAGGAFAIFHKSSNKTTTASSSTSSTSTKSGAIIQTKTMSGMSYLADSSGNALYTYGADTSGVSNCSGSCLASWPIYAVTTSTPTLPANVTVIKRSDGSSQYAYKGLPLYTFTGDSAGQMTGDNVGNFHVAIP